MSESMVDAVKGIHTHIISVTALHCKGKMYLVFTFLATKAKVSSKNKITAMRPIYTAYSNMAIMWLDV